MPTGLGDEQLWLCPSLDNVTPFNDLSSQGNNGTAVGGLSTVADTGSGGAYSYDFDGTNDYIDTGSTTVHQNTLFTYSFWINASASTSGTDGTAGSYETAGYHRGPLASSISGDNKLTWLYMSLGSAYNSAQQLKSVGDVYDSTWRHVVCEFDGNNNEVKIYIDGTLDSSKTASVPNTVNISTPLKFGAGSGGYTTGRMDDVRVYNRALTQSEITHLATARGIEGRPFDGLGDEKLWLCPSLENSPNDISGNNNNGVYQGGAGTISDVAEGGTRSYEFTNSSHYITGTTDLDTTDDFSLSYWYRSNTGNSFGTNYHIFRARNGTRGFNFYKYYGSGTQTYTGTTICRGGASSNSSTPVNYGITTADWLDWHCFTMNWDNASSTMEYFIDGVSVGTWNASVSGSVDATGTTMILGALGNGTGTANGYIDDLRKYSRKLTQSEISWLATERGVLGTPPEGLGDEQLWLCPSIQDSTNDLSGNNNNGVYQNGMGTVADTAEGGSLAYDFDGVGDYIDITGYANSKTAYSLSTWINGTGPNQTVVAFNVGDSSGSRSLNLGLQPSAIVLAGHQVSPSYYWAESTSTVNGAGWKHVAATYDGSDVKIYVDGVLEDTQAAPNSTTAQTRAFIGRWVGSTPFWLTGKMDDIRAYNRALTQAEITHLASQRGVLGGPPLPEGLGDEQLWLCPSIDDSPDDLSGNNNHGTYVGGMGTIADTGAGGSLAYNIDTTSKYVDCGNILDAPAQFSISAWVNRGTRADVTGIAGKWNGSGYMLYNSTPQVAIDGGPHTSGSTQIPASTWQHLAATYDGTTIRLYQDGVETSSQAHAAPSSTSATYQVGAYLSSGFRSLIDDVRQYDRPLTQSEISWLSTERGVLGTPPEGLGGEQMWISATNNNTGTSTAFNDLSGNGNNGTSNGATIIADTSNGGTYCMDFNGSSDVVTPYKDQTVTSTGVFSMALWVKHDSVASTRGLMAGNIQTNNTGLQVIFDAFDATRGHSGALNPNISGQYSGLCNAGDRDSTSTGVWYHIAYTGDGTTARLYINGTEVVSQSFGSFSAATWRNPLTLGCFYTGVGTKGGFLDGQIDDARVFGRTITQAEITHLASQRGVLGAPEGLGDEQLWLCPSIQDSANDLSGNGNDGVYNGGMGTVTSDSKLAYDLDGVDDYIECSGPTGNTGSFSLSLWASRGNGQSVTTTMAAQYDPVNVDRYWLLQQKTSTSGVAFRTYPVATTSTGRVDSETTSIAGNGVWYHITALYDATAGEQRLYIDGVLVDSDSSTGFQSTTIGLLLGWAGGQNWLGMLDDIRTYDRALTQSEISWLATERGVLGTPPEGLGDETCWVCPTLTQNSTTDITNSGLTITTTGSVAVTADTGASGTHANFCQGNGTNQAGHEVIIDNFGNTYAEATSVSWWSRRTAGSNVIEMGGGTNQWPTAASSRFFYQHWNGADRCYMYNTSGGTNGWINETGSNATWKHHVMVREGVGGKNRLYINGVLDTEEYDDGGAETTGKDMYFGIGGGGSSDGELYMDDMRTYGRVLTQAEITHLASQRGVLGSPATTTQYNAFLTHAFRQLFQTRLR